MYSVFPRLDALRGGFVSLLLMGGLSSLPGQTLAQTANRGSGDLVQLIRKAESRQEPAAPASCDTDAVRDDEARISALKTCIAQLENLGRWTAQKAAYRTLEQLLQKRPRVEQLNLMHELSNKMRRYDSPIQALEIKRAILSDPAATGNLRVVQHQALAIDSALVFLDAQTARQHLGEMESINRQRRNGLRQEFVDLMDATTAGARAAVLLSEGDHAGALKNYERYLQGYERYLGQIPRLEREFRVDSPDAVRGYLYTGRTYVVETLLRAGELERAEQQARALLKEQLMVLSAGSPQLARTLVMYGRVLLQQGRFKEARFFNSKALSALERSGIEPEARIGLQAQAAQIDLGLANADWSAAKTGWEAYRKLKTLSGEPVAFEPAWVVVLHRAGQPQLALQQSEGAWRRAQRLPAGTMARVEAQAFHAMALSINGRQAEAAPLVREAVPRLVQALAGGNTQGHEFLRIKLMYLLDGLGRLATATPEVARTAQEPLWLLSEALKFTSVHKAVASSAARSTANEGLRALIREEQDLGLLAQTLARAIENLELVGGRDDDPVLQRLREKLTQAEQTRVQVLGRIQKQFPAYAQMLGGLPSGLQAVREVLRPGESYVSISPLFNGVLVAAVNASGQEKLHFSPTSPEQIKAAVARLRATVEFSSAAGSAVLPPFDFETAHQLYKELLAPVETITAGKGLMLASVSGELATVPLGLWVQAPFAPKETATAFETYRSAPWLAMAKDIAYVPSATALVALRAPGKRQTAQAAFAGFGDPDFSVSGKVPAAAGSSPARASQRLLRIADEDLLALDPLPDSIPAIPALPETRDEVMGLARLFNADPGKSLYLGKRASRSNALSEDLSRYRVLAFATHGLIPGDVPGLNQPALAMSTADPNGYLLTAQDILGMRLNADWVILSACNSGAGEGSSAEALSGLGRSFFYAGSRSIYVTQWPVESESAKQLVLRTLEEFQTAGLGRAQAASAAMRHVMHNGSAEFGGQRVSYAHPAFWAPYMLVGEPGRD